MLYITDYAVLVHYIRVYQYINSFITKLLFIFFSLLISLLHYEFSSVVWRQLDDLVTEESLST